MASSIILLTAADVFKSSAYVSEPSGIPKGAITGTTAACVTAA